MSDANVLIPNGVALQCAAVIRSYMRCRPESLCVFGCEENAERWRVALSKNKLFAPPGRAPYQLLVEGPIDLYTATAHANDVLSNMLINGAVYAIVAPLLFGVTHVRDIEIWQRHAPQIVARIPHKLEIGTTGDEGVRGNRFERYALLIWLGGKSGPTIQYDLEPLSFSERNSKSRSGVAA